MSSSRLSVFLLGSAFFLGACLAEEAAPSATAVPVQPTAARPALLSPAPTLASPSPSPSVRVDTYTVQDGDSLTSIASRLYRDADAWETIYDANRDQLSTPDELKVGQVLRIPPAPTPGPTSAATRVPPTSVAATSVPATGVPPTSVPSTAAPTTAAPTSAPPSVASTSVPPAFVPASAATSLAGAAPPPAAAP